MMACYGVDTLAPGLSLRRMSVLMRRLGLHCPRGISVDDPWSQESHLLATVVDAIRYADVDNQQLWSKKKLKPPKPLERPGQQRDGSSTEDAVPKRATPVRDLVRALRGAVSNRGR